MEELERKKQDREYGWLRLSTQPRPLQSRDLENSQDEALKLELFIGIGFGSAGFEPWSKVFLSFHPSLHNQETIPSCAPFPPRLQLH